VGVGAFRLASVGQGKVVHQRNVVARANLGRDGSGLLECVSQTPERQWLADRFQTVIISESFVIADWTDSGEYPGLPIAAMHLHRSDDEVWIVLEGPSLT
jgi:hypothetical protein